MDDILNSHNLFTLILLLIKMVIYQLYMKLSTQTRGEANCYVFPFRKSPPIIDKLVLCLCSSANMHVYITYVRSYVNDNLSLPYTPFSYRLQFNFRKAVFLENVLNFSLQWPLFNWVYNVPSLFIVVMKQKRPPCKLDSFLSFSWKVMHGVFFDSLVIFFFSDLYWTEYKELKLIFDYGSWTPHHMRLIFCIWSLRK